jgi:hypothetical protein
MEHKHLMTKKKSVSWANFWNDGEGYYSMDIRIDSPQLSREVALARLLTDGGGRSSGSEAQGEEKPYNLAHRGASAGARRPVHCCFPIFAEFLTSVPYLNRQRIMLPVARDIKETL